MADMSQVVEAMLERLRVDLAQDEIVTALQVFNVAFWQQADLRSGLSASAVKLCKLLTLSERTGGLIGQYARILGPLLKAAQATRVGDVGNKHAWSWVLCPSWRVRHASKVAWTDECHTLVAFYLSLKTNTTTLERDLGHLLRQLEAHSGPLTPNGSTIGAILEVAVEGPQEEKDFFEKPSVEGGPMTPTKFGVACAEMWICHFGRRFRCTYNKEVKAGPKVPRTKAVGTLASVVRGRAKATNALVQSAQAADARGRQWKPASFVQGLNLPLSPPAQDTFAGTRWASASGATSASQHLAQFRKTTKRKADGSLAYLIELGCLY